MIDPFLVFTVVTGISVGITGLAVLRARNEVRFGHEREVYIATLSGALKGYRARALDAEAVLERRRQQRLIAAKLGSAASQKKAAALRVARQNNTHEAIANIHMRSRAEVVANVAAIRAAKKSGAGVAAIKTG